MIPKTIHRVWLGPKPTDDTWLDGWRKACPGWEIRTWTDRDLEGIDVPYVKEALAAKKWAFVADYLRLHALYREGGFYLDTDVELSASLDPYRGDSFVVGLVKSGLPQTAVIGAEKGSPVAKELLATYEGARFDFGHGVYDERPINLRFRTVLARHGASLTSADAEREQSLPGGIRILPRSLVCIRSEGKPNVAWHHAVGTWQDAYKRKRVWRAPFFGLGAVLLKRRKMATDDYSEHLLDDERTVGDFRFRRFVFVFVRLAKRVAVGKAIENVFQGVRRSIGRFLCRRIWTRIEPRKIVFEQFHGNGYGCNLKYIANELLRRGGWDVVWLANRPKAGVYPQGVRVVARRSSAALRELATAGFWCFNHNVGHFVRHRGLVKKPGQRYYQTWHGSFGIKYCHDVVTPDERAMIDGVISNSVPSRNEMRSCFGEDIPLLDLGYPRLDPLVTCDPALRAEVRSRLGTPDGVKTLVYAPTFRDDGDRSAYLADFRPLLAALSARFGGEWRIWLRLHPNLRKHDVRLEVEGAADDVSTYEDLQELMVASDAMISDYSSCVFDYILTGKPAFLYVPDRAKYEGDRGLFYPLEESPFPVCATEAELEAAVHGFSEADFAAREREFLRRAESVEDGRSAARVADFLEKGVQDGDKRKSLEGQVK